LKSLCLKGEIFSGAGEGAKFIELTWVKRQMEEQLGFTLFPGTLNVKLTKDSVKMGKLLKKRAGVEILPASGYCRGRLFKAMLNGVECAVIVPEVVGYPENIVEVVAPVNLREKLCLLDGSLVEFEVTL
jgi:riboflavin kinase, archaea type